MGRLQRKKHPGKKKDKRVDIAASSQLNSGVHAKKADSSTGFLQKTKKQVLPQKKHSSTSKLSTVKQNISKIESQRSPQGDFKTEKRNFIFSVSAYW